jgi:hypothetical protein
LVSPCTWTAPSVDKGWLFRSRCCAQLRNQLVMIQQKQMSCFLLRWKKRIPAKSQKVPATTWQKPKNNYWWATKYSTYQ